MSVKVFIQFIILLLIIGGGYAFYMRDQIHFDHNDKQILSPLSPFNHDMSQRQQDIATDKSVDKIDNHYNKIGFAAKIADFFSPKDSEVGITEQKIQDENNKIQKNLAISKEIEAIQESDEDEYTKQHRIEKLAKNAPDME